MATCENCWKAFEAGYGEAEKSYLATIEAREAEATRLREALETTRKGMIEAAALGTTEVGR